MSNIKRKESRTYARACIYQQRWETTFVVLCPLFLQWVECIDAADMRRDATIWTYYTHYMINKVRSNMRTHTTNAYTYTHTNDYCTRSGATNLWVCGIFFCVTLLILLLYERSFFCSSLFLRVPPDVKLCSLLIYMKKKFKASYLAAMITPLLPFSAVASCTAVESKRPQRNGSGSWMQTNVMSKWNRKGAPRNTIDIRHEFGEYYINITCRCSRWRYMSFCFII